MGVRPDRTLINQSWATQPNKGTVTHIFSTMPHPVPLVLLLLLLAVSSLLPSAAAGTFTNHTISIPVRCLPDQVSPLFWLKHSFTVTNKSDVTGRASVVLPPVDGSLHLIWVIVAWRVTISIMCSSSWPPSDISTWVETTSVIPKSHQPGSNSSPGSPISTSPTPTLQDKCQPIALAASRIWSLSTSPSILKSPTCSMMAIWLLVIGPTHGSSHCLT